MNDTPAPSSKLERRPSMDLSIALVEAAGPLLEGAKGDVILEALTVLMASVIVDTLQTQLERDDVIDDISDLLKNQVENIHRFKTAPHLEPLPVEWLKFP
jgi:hypothetical protein